MKYYFIIGLFAIALYGCNNQDDSPIIESEAVNYFTQTNNTIDAYRLCFAEVISAMLENLEFRRYIQTMSKGGPGWNNELLLIELLNQNIGSDSFRHLVENVLDEIRNSCFTNFDQLTLELHNDPLLVIKIPDIFNPDLWDVNEVIPVVYANTVQLVSNFPGSSTGSNIGLHASGFVDRYEYGVPRYFPLTLKYSDDYILFDNDLKLLSGLHISDYHDYDNSFGTSDDIFKREIIISGMVFYLLKLNDLLDALNSSGNNIQQPYILDTCLNLCPYECIPFDQRKLTSREITIHSTNSSAIEFEFASHYRWNSHLILEDNIIPFIMTRQIGINGGDSWQKKLLGSFRLNSLFRSHSSYSVSNQEFCFRDEVITLPLLNVSLQVADRLTLPIESLVLAENIGKGDLLRFSSNRIKLDRLGSLTTLQNGDVIWSTEFFQDNLTNYDLYCFMRDDTLGINSLGVLCDY